MQNILPYPLFRADALNGFIALGITFFFALTLVYSWVFMKGRKGLFKYYVYILLAALCSVVLVLANDLIVLLCLWGFLGLLLYLLINMGDESSAPAAKKALIIVGGTDALMLLGFGIVYHLSGTAQIDMIRLSLSTPLSLAAYLCIVIAAFAKAGVMPFHTWLPDSSQHAPLPVAAFLLAALDKLLGIYLLFRVSLGLFIMNEAAGSFLMCLGAFTVLASAMITLTQNNIKRLLSYCAISQVGYIVLGLGSGTALGVAGALFHMLNHAIYKSCLFFNAGNIEYRAKTVELDELGGLGKAMPFTYITCMIASFSVSAVPPFNGFMSKLLIYQGLVSGMLDKGFGAGTLISALCLAAAMFGSGLTLASFIKLIHGAFLGERLLSKEERVSRDVPWQMWLPCCLLSAICLLFGVFAFQLPLRYFIFPAVSLYQALPSQAFSGSWVPLAAAALILVGLLAGLLIFRASKGSGAMRQDSDFVGGEVVRNAQDEAVTGIDFYNTVREFRLLSFFYRKAEEGRFDIYEQAKSASFVSRALQYLHNGVLPTYLVWMLLGMLGLFFFLVR